MAKSLACILQLLSEKETLTLLWGALPPQPPYSFAGLHEVGRVKLWLSILHVAWGVVSNQPLPPGGGQVDSNNVGEGCG